MMKRQNCGRYPIFYLIRHAVNKLDGSGFEGFLNSGAWIRRQPLYEAMLEIAGRYVRRYNPIAYRLGDIEDRISARFNNAGGSYKFHKEIPHRSEAIGTLTVDANLRITATAISTPIAYSAARYRDKELAKLKRKKVQPTGALLDVWILQKETEEVLRLTSVIERQKNAYNRRSEAAKQAWIRRKQSSCSGQQRGSFEVACSNHG